jgi:hypothetical protein
MIIARISKTLSTLMETNTHHFCTKTHAHSSKTFIKNDNLTYEDQHHKLTTYFFLPELKKTQNETYEINRNSNVLSFLWEPKHNKKIAEKADADQKAK